MGSSSFLNAFRLIFKKPVLLLLLLPLQLARPLLSVLMPASGASSGLLVSAADQAQQTAASFGSLGLELLLLLLAGFFLIPPAMELLHDGAQGREPAPGWYGRGMGRHGWKPVAIGAIESVIIGVLAVILIIIFIVLFFGAAIGISSSLSNDINSNVGDIYSSMTAVMVPVLIFLAIFIVIIEWIESFFAMLLPATADRGFGEAFKVLFSKTGFKKTCKVFGVYLLIGFVSVLVTAVFAAVYVIAGNKPVSLDNAEQMMIGFESSWLYYGASVIVSLAVLFKYGYIFSVFQEIKNKEAAALPPAPKDAWIAQQ